MNSLTLKHLRYFLAVADRGQFASAAADCAISQPALSLQIKQLEAVTGITLLERTTRKVHLTPSGKLLAAHARQIMALVDNTEYLLRNAETELAGRMCLGVIPTVAPYLLPTAIARISRDFPRLELDMREAVTPLLIDDLKAGRIDAALVALPIDEPDLAEHLIATEKFLFARAAKDAGAPVPDAAALRKMKLLLLEEGHCFRAQALAFCNIRDANAHRIMNGSSLTTLVQLVASGVGVTLIPEMAAKLETRMAKVDLRRFPGEEPSRKIGLAWRRSHPLRQHLPALAEVICAAAADLQQSIQID